MHSAESVDIGFQVLNRPHILPARRTVLVMALARGGSSFIASTLAHLGVPFDQRPPNYDDGELFAAIYDRNWPVVRRRIEEMNAKHSIWGAKMMGPAAHLLEAIQLTRNPMVICVFSDPVAVALQKQMVGKEAYAQAHLDIAEAIANYGTLAVTLRSLPQEIPMMVVSYNNTIQNPIAFVRGVNDFIGQPATKLPDNEAEEIAAVILEEGGYRRAKARKITDRTQKAKEAAQARRAERAAARKGARKKARKTQDIEANNPELAEQQRRQRQEARRWRRRATPPPRP